MIDGISITKLPNHQIIKSYLLSLLFLIFGLLSPAFALEAKWLPTAPIYQFFMNARGEAFFGRRATPTAASLEKTPFKSAQQFTWQVTPTALEMAMTLSLTLIGFLPPKPANLYIQWTQGGKASSTEWLPLDWGVSPLTQKSVGRPELRPIATQPAPTPPLDIWSYDTAPQHRVLLNGQAYTGVTIAQGGLYTFRGISTAQDDFHYSTMKSIIKMGRQPTDLNISKGQPEHEYRDGLLVRQTSYHPNGQKKDEMNLIPVGENNSWKETLWGENEKNRLKLKSERALK